MRAHRPVADACYLKQAGRDVSAHMAFPVCGRELIVTTSLVWLQPHFSRPRFRVEVVKRTAPTPSVVKHVWLIQRKHCVGLMEV